VLWQKKAAPKGSVEVLSKQKAFLRVVGKKKKLTTMGDEGSSTPGGQSEKSPKTHKLQNSSRHGGVKNTNTILAFRKRAGMGKHPPYFENGPARSRRSE